MTALVKRPNGSTHRHGEGKRLHATRCRCIRPAFAALRRGSLRAVSAACQVVARETREDWWEREDSNLRRRKPADLQSAPFATRDTLPRHSGPPWTGRPAEGAVWLGRSH